MLRHSQPEAETRCGGNESRVPQEGQGTDMAWGMHEPSGFGEFFPDGGYVGWKEALNDYYQKEMSAAEKNALGMEKRFRYSAFVSLIRDTLDPVKDALFPSEFCTVKSYKKLGSLITLNSRILAVDAQFRALIEELEPGIHQFWPIKISMPRNKVNPEQYYGLRIGQFRDTFNPDHSDSSCYNISGYETYRGIAPVKKVITGLALSKDAIGGAHLWREKKLTQPDIFLSETLQARAMDAGLRLPKHFRMKEV